MSTKNNDQNNCDVHLHAEIEALKKALVEKQNRLITMETACLRDSDRQAELEDSIIAWQDKYDRLYESHKRVQKVNQSLEDKLLKLVDRDSGDRAQLTSDVATLSVRLAQANYNIAKLQREIKRYKNDINLAIQLLQCKPDNFVPQKVSSLPMDIQSKVSSYMRLETNSHSDSEGSTNGVGVTRSGSYKVLPASDSPPPICPFPPTAMVYSMRGIDAQNSECNDNSTEQLISPSIMAKYLEDELKSNEIKHCDTCKCSLKDLTVLADEQKTYNIGTQTILHGDNNSSLCLRCNSNLNSPSRTNSPYIMKLVKSSDSVISETKSSVSDFNDNDKLFIPAKKDDLMVNPILGHHRLCDRTAATTTTTSQTSTTIYNHNHNNNNKKQQQQPFNSILTSKSYLSTTLPTSITTQATIINDTAKYFNENQHNLINSNHKQNNDEHDLIDLNKFINNNNNNTNKNNIKNSIITTTTTTNNINNHKSPKMSVNNDIKINSNDNNNIIVNDIVLNNHNNQLLNDTNRLMTVLSSSSSSSLAAAAVTATTITNTNPNSTIITTPTTTPTITTTTNNNNNNNINNNASRKSDLNNLLIDTIEINSNTSNNINNINNNNNNNNNGIVQGNNNNNNIINNKNDNSLIKNNENIIENNNENCLLNTTITTTPTTTVSKINTKNNLQQQQQQQTISATGSTNSLWSKTSSSEGAKLFENFNRNLIKTIKAENPKYRGPRLCALRIQNGSNNILLDGIESELQPVLYTRRQRFLDEELDDTKDIITSKISMVMSTSSSSITNLPSSLSLNNEILIGQDLSILETPLSPNKQNLNHDIKDNHDKNDIKLQQQQHQQQQNNLITSMMVINTQPSCSVSNFGSIQQQQQQQHNLNNMPTSSNELFFHQQQQQQQQQQSSMEISNFDMITLCDNSLINSSFKNTNSKSCTQSSSLSSSNCLNVVELQENALLRRQQLNRVAEWVQNNSQMEQQQQQINNTHKILINNNSIQNNNFDNNLNTNTNTSFDNNIKFSLQNANNNNNTDNSIEKLSINNECNLNKSNNQQQQISNGIYNAQQMNKKQLIMNYHTIPPTITTTNININNYHNSYLNNDNKIIAQNNYIINCNYYDNDNENNKNGILKIQQQQQQQQLKQLNGEEKIEKDNWLEHEQQQQQQQINNDNENFDNNQKLHCNNINDKSLNQVDLAQMEYNVKQFLLKQNEWSIRNNKPISSNSSCSNKTPTIADTIQKQSNKNQISNNYIDNNNLNININNNNNNNSSNNTITKCYPHRTETNL